MPKAELNTRNSTKWRRKASLNGAVRRRLVEFLVFNSIYLKKIIVFFLIAVFTFENRLVIRGSLCFFKKLSRWKLIAFFPNFQKVFAVSQVPRKNYFFLLVFSTVISREGGGGSSFVFNGKINFLRETVTSNKISERSNFKSIRGTKIFLKKYSRCKVFAVWKCYRFSSIRGLFF